MRLSKNGKIQHCCHPNALITLKEYLLDYASKATKSLGDEIIEDELKKIENQKTKETTAKCLEDIMHGKRDFRL